LNRPLITYDPRDYDSRVTATDDVEFWLAEAALAHGPILELGCGTGRITIPLASNGFKVTGLDVSEPMLRRARAKGSDEGVGVTWCRGDMREFALSERYALIFCPFGTFNHLRHDEVGQCLSLVRDHLLPEGNFALDTFGPGDYGNSNDEDNIPHNDSGGFSSFTRSEIEGLLTSSGFRVTASYGDYDRAEFSGDSTRLILKAVLA